jgi:hypothetical protein
LYTYNEVNFVTISAIHGLSFGYHVAPTYFEWRLSSEHEVVASKLRALGEVPCNNFRKDVEKLRDAEAKVMLEHQEAIKAEQLKKIEENGLEAVEIVPAETANDYIASWNQYYFLGTSWYI